MSYREFSYFYDYFNYNADNKEIILYNNFKKDKAKSNKFVVITEKEKEFLIQQDDNLLCKYLLYIKYYCGKSKTKTTDFTAEQFFAAIGYSKKSGSYKSLLSNYNGILSARGFIKIDKYRENGKERNIYAL